MTESEKQILTQLQRGIEITSQPFLSLETLDVLKKARAAGLLRRFGGIFDSRRLGYKSMLCALDVPEAGVDAAADVLRAHPGVTHCYERRPFSGGNRYPVLWFTLAMLRNDFDEGIEALRSQLETRNSKPETQNSQLLQLPALHRFKIDVIFDLQPHPGGAPAAAGMLPGDDSAPTAPFSDAEKNLVREIDQELPLVERPFAGVAEQMGRSEEWVLSTLRTWKERGVLRRIGAILYHREAGFTANAMCVWPVDGDIAAAGLRVAARPEVTHCYQRPRLDAFPFDLYAMIHTPSWDETVALYQDISESCGLVGGELFVSGREFKKTSMKYFREE